jgi:hypothetical protein
MQTAALLEASEKEETSIKRLKVLIHACVDVPREELRLNSRKSITRFRPGRIFYTNLS